jgi:hypothetical protein
MWVLWVQDYGQHSDSRASGTTEVTANSDLELRAGSINAIQSLNCIGESATQAKSRSGFRWIWPRTSNGVWPIRRKRTKLPKAVYS